MEHCPLGWQRPIGLELVSDLACDRVGPESWNLTAPRDHPFSPFRLQGSRFEPRQLDLPSAAVASDFQSMSRPFQFALLRSLAYRPLPDSHRVPLLLPVDRKAPAPYWPL